MSRTSPMTRPTIEPFEPRELGPKDWGTELLVAETLAYTGKVLSMRAGAVGPLQYHVRKDETMHVISGKAWIEYDPGTGALHRKTLAPGMSVRVPPGAVHRVGAIDDTVFFEASTPALNDRVNVESEYA